jgi:hypothetical protein
MKRCKKIPWYTFFRICFVSGIQQLDRQTFWVSRNKTRWQWRHSLSHEQPNWGLQLFFLLERDCRVDGTVRPVERAPDYRPNNLCGFVIYLLTGGDPDITGLPVISIRRGVFTIFPPESFFSRLPVSLSWVYLFRSGYSRTYILVRRPVKFK